MCGICGIQFLNKRPVEKEILVSMNKTLTPRGPDDEGYYIHNSVGLAMKRLSIIDFKTGHQPISNEDGSVWIVSNGEIYNFRELRNTLERHGHRFSTQSDTESIIHAYEEWGESCLKHLRGMFAFAIHDQRPQIGEKNWSNGRLFLARDRLGIKPLYYSKVGQTIIFASEIKALRASGFIPQELNKRSLIRYLQWGFVPGPETIIEGIYLLPAGHYLAFDAQGLRVGRYWPKEIHPIKVRSLAQAVQDLKEKLTDAVHSEIVADVPVGAFLSGGLDSSAIVALMSPLATGRLRTFSISFDEAKYNETPFVKLVVQRFNTNHYDCRVKSQDVKQNLDHFIASLDQPSVDGLNTYFISKFTHESGAKVALSGLGGDELFGGYPSFRQLPKLSSMMRIGHMLPGVISLGRFVTNNNRLVNKYRKLYQMLGTDGSISSLYAIGRSLFLSDNIAHLLAPDFAEDIILAKTIREAHVISQIPDVINTPWSITSWLEMEWYMRNQLLRDTDCMSMTHSLEVRVPLLDYHLVEYVIGLPEKFKRFGRIPKAILAQAMSSLLPREIIQRRKMTFTFPLKEWMRGCLQQEIGDALCAPSVKAPNIFNSAATSFVWKEFLDNRLDWTRPWGLAVLIMWMQKHMLD